MCVDLCFLICLYVPILLCFPQQLSQLLTVFGASITNLNEPPRALDASTIYILYLCFSCILFVFSVLPCGIINHDDDDDDDDNVG